MKESLGGSLAVKLSGSLVTGESVSSGPQPIPLDLSDSDGGVWVEDPAGTWTAPSAVSRAVDSVHVMLGDGRLILQFANAATLNGSAPVSLDRDAILKDYNLNDISCHVNITSGIYVRTDEGSDVNVPGDIVAVSGDLYSLNRVGSTLTMERSQDNGGTWSVLYTYTFTTTDPLYAHFQSFGDPNGRQFIPTGIGFTDV